jgi:hypothetical protein
MKSFSRFNLFRFNFKGVKSKRKANENRYHQTRPSYVPHLEVLEDRTQPSTFTVTNLNNTGAGSLPTEVAAANAATGSSIIQFAKHLHGTITLSNNELLITNSVAIDGPGDKVLAISGDNSDRVFEIAEGQTVSISGLTISQGQASGSDGGGILIDANATVNLDHVDLSNNQALADSQGNNGSGGGIENDGSVTVMDSVFTNNRASMSSTSTGSNGGAIDSSGPSLTVSHSLFTDNQTVGTSTGVGSADGGAINNNGSTAAISDSTFFGNSASARTVNGGAISNEAGTMNATGDTFTSNQAIASNGGNDITNPNGDESLGGAIFSGSTLFVDKGTFTDNLAKGGDLGDNSTDGADGGGFVGIATGGGICNFFGTASVSNSTFLANQAIGGNMAIGPGGAAAGGGIMGGGSGATTTINDVSFTGNIVQGGNGGPGYPGGVGAGGGFYNGIIDATASVSNSFFLNNLAKGGTGGSGASGGVGQGGAIANGGSFDLLAPFGGQDTSTITVSLSSLISNAAQGGMGGAGAVGGNGLGGGFFTIDGTTASIAATLIESNGASGGLHGKGGANGQGMGGGLYIDTGASMTLSDPHDVFLNHASTGNDDIFGVYST